MPADANMQPSCSETLTLEAPRSTASDVQLPLSKDINPVANATPTTNNTPQVDPTSPVRAVPHHFGGQRLSALRQQFADVLENNFNKCATDPVHAAACSESAQPRTGKGRFRGVTRHKRTQRYEAHIWECKKQIYLGGFDSEVLAAKSHDIMALRCKGTGCDMLNFPEILYTDLVPTLFKVSREDVITALRNYSKAQIISKAQSNAASSTPKGVRKKASRTSNKSSNTAVNRKLTVRTSLERSLGRGDSSSVSPYRIEFKGKIGNPMTKMPPPGSVALSGTPLVPKALSVALSTPFNPKSRSSTMGGNHHGSNCTPMDFDTLDIDNVIDALIADDFPQQALTYSASEESCLYQSMPTDASHTVLEHVNGVSLVQDIDTMVANGDGGGTPMSKRVPAPPIWFDSIV